MKILLIEDDDMTRELLAEELSAAHYVVEQANNGELGLELASLWPSDLILLDLQIPKLDGLSVCRQLRARGNKTPILMLTAHNAQEDIVTGLDSGADDYVTKPFEVNQVLARIRALLRRGTMVSSQGASLTWGKLTLNPATAEVKYGDRTIPLTPKEYSLLELFLRNPQRVFSRGVILDHLWAVDDYPTEGAVTNLVKDLRNRLKRNGVTEEVIQTVYGLGYRLKTDAAEPDKPAPETASKASIKPGSSAQTVSNLAAITARFQSSIQQRIGVLEEVTRALQAGGVATSQQALAREEAHRLAGGLGTFGYEEGSTLARQIEYLLKEDPPLEKPTINQLSQTLLALKQVVVSDAHTSSFEADPGTNQQHILAMNLPTNVSLSLQAIGASHHWRVTVYAGVENALNQPPDPAVDVLLLGVDAETPIAQKFLPLEKLKHQWPRVPVVVLSACEALAERVQAARCGAERYLVNDITPEQLQATLQGLLTPPEAEKSRVMVVDNDAQNCTHIAASLAAWGLQVTTLQDATQFWAVLRQTNPALLMVEREMPTFSGIDLCRVVRSDSQYGNLPILIMTRQSHQLSVQQVFELGCDDVICKPIISPEWITRVLCHIEGKRPHQQLSRMRKYSVPVSDFEFH
jgi:DNA-binding response OmpR family regulator/HPt (histidine-containing phosphotransfer) domain-containing protein